MSPDFITGIAIGTVSTLFLVLVWTLFEKRWAAKSREDRRQRERRINGNV